MLKRMWWKMTLSISQAVSEAENYEEELEFGIVQSVVTFEEVVSIEWQTQDHKDWAEDEKVGAARVDYSFETDNVERKEGNETVV